MTTELIKDIILISFIVTGVFYSGFPMEIEATINRVMKKSGRIGTFVLPKPFSCALCTTFWISLIWTLCVYGFSLTNVLLCLLAGLSTTVLDNLYALVLDTSNTVLIRINEILNNKSIQ